MWSRCVDLTTGDELITAGEVGNELVVYEEYHEHPVFREGPRHLLPTGVSTGSAAHPARSVTAERSRLGRRITVTGSLGPVTYTQTVTLWDGLARVDCATHVDGFDGADQLVRLRWPCAVPGAMPVSEVGHAVVGRPFAHPDVDTADHPWTLDNPAYQWFGLSAPARISFANGTGVPIAVAEIVVPHEEDTADARDLAVRLAQSGVTSTTSYAHGTRYGLLSFDSNLPDVRFSLGGPLENTFTAEALARRRTCVHGGTEPPARREGLGGRLAARPVHPRAGLPPRGGRCAARSTCRSWWSSARRTTLSRTTSSAIDQAADHVEERRTVAVLNRGVPGFAVDLQGRLHLSLMRSSTGWPSGMWIDPPRRTAPDGTGFGLQHWSHTFDYALASGGGDWRDAGIVAKAHDYNHPLRPVVEPAHDGPLPATASLVTVEPAGAAVLAAFKAAGNPTAGGGALPADPRAGITARFYEPHGRPVSLRVTSPFPLVEAAVADLLETATSEAKVRDGALVADLGPSEIATFVLKTDTPDPEGSRRPAGEVGRARPAGVLALLAAQPGVGAARLPAAERPRPSRPPGQGHGLAGQRPRRRRRRGRGPRGRAARLGGRRRPIVRYGSRPAAGPPSTSRCVPPPTRAKGPGPSRSRWTHGGQTHEDVVFFDGSGHPVSPGPASLLAVDVPEEGLSLSAGERAVLPVTLTNHAPYAIRGEIQVLGPWGTWDVTGPLIHPLDIGPGESRALDVVADVPLGVRPGEWWLLVKAMWFGRVSYSPAVPFTGAGGTVIAALIEGTPVTLEQVTARMAALRRGPRGDLLPADGTTEGRQLRRWVVQLLVAERVVAAEARRRGLRPGGPPMELSATARLELGSVMAAVLAGDPLAQAVYRDLTADVTVSERGGPPLLRRQPRPLPAGAGPAGHPLGTGAAHLRRDGRRDGAGGRLHGGGRRTGGGVRRGGVHATGSRPSPRRRRRSGRCCWTPRGGGGSRSGRTPGARPPC